MEKVVQHSKLGIITFKKSLRSKTVRVSISPSYGIKVTLPVLYPYNKAQKFVDDNINRILGILQKQKETIHTRQTVRSADPNEEKETRREARKILIPLTRELSDKLNANAVIKNAKGEVLKDPFKYNRIALKNNKSNWGSCSVRRNINLNINLIKLPPEIMRYVILHELCHLIHMNHGKEFHTLLNKLCGGREKELSQALRKYKL